VSALALFMSAFVSATLLPMASEVPLALIVRSTQEVVWPVTVATAGNFLGACTTYWIARAVSRKAGIGADEESTATGRTPSRAWRLFQRYGAPSLLLSWVPIIGDGIVVVAGLAPVRVVPFTIFTLAGKAVRYWVVATIALRA
jgi:membrane protein YqaA with SNARE-associated domain